MSLKFLCVWILTLKSHCCWSSQVCVACSTEVQAESEVRRARRVAAQPRLATPEIVTVSRTARPPARHGTDFL